MGTMSDPAQALSVTVNRSKCCGYGICVDLCPSVFRLDDQGFAVVDGPVSVGLEEEVREAAYECPAEAIAVEPAAAQDSDIDQAT